MATKKAETPVVESDGMDEFSAVAEPEPVEVTPEEAAKADDKAKQRLSNKLYTEATAALREAHKDEFVALLKEKYAAAGLEYVPRLTAEERKAVVEAEKFAKAQAKLEALYEQFPGLRPQA